MTTSVGHPTLKKTDAESVRVFLRTYDQYTREVAERSAQLQLSGAVTTEPVRPVSLKFCVDIEYVEASLLLGVIEGAGEHYDDLTDESLRAHLEQKATTSPETISLDRLDSIIKAELRMNMKDISSRSRMLSLFVSYTSIIKRHGSAWVIK